MANIEFSPMAAWSPHTAALHRRRRVSTKDKDQALAGLGKLDLEGSEEEEDYLAKALKKPVASTKKSPRKKKSQSFYGPPRSASNSPSRKNGRSTSHSPVRKPRSLKGMGAGKLPPLPHKGSGGASSGAPAAVSAKKASAQKKIKLEELKEEIGKFPKHIQEKLNKMIDPKTPLKERLEMEVEMMKDPEEASIFHSFRYKLDKNNILIKKAEEEDEEEEQLAKNLSEEAKRSAEERKEFERKKQERLDEERRKVEAEKKLERDVRKHLVTGLAQGAEALRKEAEKSVAAAVDNKNKKIEADNDVEKAIQAFREGEGKHMTDVERNLRIAMIEQRAIQSGDLDEDED